MNPHFQQQNNSPYPQDNLYYSPENLPDTTKYPTLPPIQNPQYNHYPAPQQPHFNPNPIYNPPEADYKNIPILQTPGAENEAFLLSNKIRDLEKSFNTRFIKCYQIWLSLLILFSSMVVFKTFVSLITGAPSGSDNPYINLNALGCIYGIWTIIQSALGISSFRQRSLVKAHITLIIMSLYLIPSLAIEVMVVVWIHGFVPDVKDDSTPLWYGFMYTILFISSTHLLTHIFVSMRCALNVRKVLKEKALVQEQIGRSEDYFRAQ